MTSVRVLVFNRSQTFLGEIEPDVLDVSWRLNNVGRAKFLMAHDDPKCTRTFLRYGNRVVVQFDNGLPTWGGVLDPPRSQTETGVTFAAYSAERIFSWRVTAKGRYFSNASPGAIFERLWRDENAQRATGLVIGSIDYGGKARSLDYHLHDVLNRFQDLARLTGQDFDTSVDFDGQRLVLKANWYEEKGIDKSGYVSLVEGENVLRAKLDEQGEIANTVRLAGAGLTWGADRYVAVASDADSAADYDYREYAEVQSGVKFSDTLDKNADELLEEKKGPRKRFQLTVANEAPGTFGQYGIGDRVTLQAFFKGGAEWTYDGTVRVIARQWRPDGTCRLEVEEYSA